MRRALGHFADQLRREGIRVSASELIDAARAIEHADLGHRESLRDALSATLAKSRRETAIFEDAFGRFFASPAFRTSRRRRRARPRRDPDGEGAGRGAPRGERSHRSRGNRERPPDAADVVRAARARMLARAGAPVPPRRYRCPVVSPPRAPERTGERARSLEVAFAERQRQGRSRAHRSPRHPRHAVDHKSFREPWSAAEEHALGAVLVRALRRLRLRRTRRRRRSRRGTIWVQRIVRANLGADGVPFRLVRHAPARREPRIVLLVDVSRSVARAAASLLVLATQLVSGLRSVRCFLFVDDVADVSSLPGVLATCHGRAGVLERLVHEHTALDTRAPSDYGRVLYAFLERHRRVLRHDTIVIVLGDARANLLDPAAWVLEEIRAHVKRIMWLVPEPVAAWDTGDSVVAAYAPHLDLLAETAEPRGLELALKTILSRP